MKNKFIKMVACLAVSLATLGVTSTQANASWIQSSSGWSYSEGTSQATGWRNINGSWYYFNSVGVMQTGWVSDSGNWYYMNADGSMKTGWLNDSGKWYYLDLAGTMHIGWLNTDGKQYYMLPDGSMYNGEKTSVACVVYYFDKSGAMIKKGGEIGTNNLQIDVVDHINVTPSKSDKPTQSNTSSAVNIEEPEATIAMDSSEFNDIFRKEFLKLINEHRKKNGLKPLESASDLEKSSLWKSKHMCNNKYLGHDYKGISWADLAEENTGIRPSAEICYGGECKGVSKGIKISEDTLEYIVQKAFNSWENSPKHNEIMLGDTWTEYGVSYYSDSTGYYAAAHFR